MFLQPFEINTNSKVTDIVAKDYRTADVFNRHSISYCCGGQWTLEVACIMKGIEFSRLQEELRAASRPFQLPAAISHESWSIDFLLDYIINIHHHYLHETFPVFGPSLNQFVAEHIKKDPGLFQLQVNLFRLRKEIVQHLREKEEIIFPYLRQLAHTYQNSETYGALLVKTLRKPIDLMMESARLLISETLFNFRKITNNYTTPGNACTSYRVIFAKLKELDNTLSQHMFLETEVLFPKVMLMEKELLSTNS